MKRFFVFAALTWFALSASHGAGKQPATDGTARTNEKAIKAPKQLPETKDLDLKERSTVAVQMAVAVDGDTPPSTQFTDAVPRLHAFFRTIGTKRGDRLKCVWVAEEVRAAVPADYKLDESTVECATDEFFGAFTLPRPAGGWPVGKYRVEIYHEGALLRISKFTIEEAKK